MAVSASGGSSVPLLIGAGTTLAGTVLGWALQRLSEARRRQWDVEDDDRRYSREKIDEHARWLRDKKVEVYTQFNTAVENMIYALNRIDDAKSRGITAMAPPLDGFRQAVGRAQEAAGTIPLVGPIPLSDAGWEIVMIAWRLHAFSDKPQRMLEDRAAGQLWRDLGRWHGMWKAAVRQDLDGYPIEKLPDDMPLRYSVPEAPQ
jgi:hypothetical protein